MDLNELIPAPNSKKVAEMSRKTFGFAVDLDNLSRKQKVALEANLNKTLNIYENTLGSKVSSNKKYYELKFNHEALIKSLNEDAPDRGYEVDELMLYAENDYDLYSRSYVPIAKNLSKKFKKGVYDSTLAVKLWKYHFDRAAKKYGQDHAGGEKEGLQMFSPADRMEAARNFEDAWHQEMQAGNFMESDVNESVIAEGQLEQSELTLAAKDMVDRVQKMLEDLGEMQNEDLAPLVDAVRDEMGTDVADQFNSAMSASISQALENMRATRESADVASRILMGEQPADMMGAPDEAPMEPTTGMDAEMGIDDPEAPAEDPEAGEDFGVADAAAGGEAELGREKRA